jgi:hypothetical protein
MALEFVDLHFELNETHLPMVGSKDPDQVEADLVGFVTVRFDKVAADLEDPEIVDIDLVRFAFAEVDLIDLDTIEVDLVHCATDIGRDPSAKTEVDFETEVDHSHCAQDEIDRRQTEPESLEYFVECDSVSVGRAKFANPKEDFHLLA